jgi:outer membrane protein OmpA-like peptidoglycan-associated protein
VSVTRNGDELLLNMPGNVTFDTDHEEIRPEFYEVLNSVVLVLKEYDRTRVEISGHTDSTGEAAYNQRLSERRAGSVGSYLTSQGVARPRVATQGRGETQPVASNSTPEGRRQNRRVEMRLAPEGA